MSVSTAKWQSLSSFFNHTVPKCKFTLKFQGRFTSKFTSILFKKFKVQFKKRNPGKRRNSLDCPFSCSGIKKFTNAHRKKFMNPFPGKFSTHCYMKDSCIIQQFSSDYSLREINSLLSSVKVGKGKTVHITTLSLWMLCWMTSLGWQNNVSLPNDFQRLSPRSWRWQLDLTRPQSQLTEAYWEDKQYTVLSDDSANPLHTISNSN